MHTCESGSARGLCVVMGFCLFVFGVGFFFSFLKVQDFFFSHENGGKMHRRQFTASSLYLPNSSVL